MAASSASTSATYSHTPEVSLVLPTPAPPTFADRRDQDVQELGLLGLVLLEEPKQSHRLRPPPERPSLSCVCTRCVCLFASLLCFYKILHRCSQGATKHVQEKTLHVLRGLAVFRVMYGGYCAYAQYFEVQHCGNFRTRSISGFCAVATPGSSSMSGSVLRVPQVLAVVLCKYSQ